MPDTKTVAQPTPGPWRHMPLSDEVLGPRGEAVCAPCDGYDEEQCAVDAKLLAAAPDLLALVYQYRDDMRHGVHGTESRARRLESIEVAIAKAEGR